MSSKELKLAAKVEKNQKRRDEKDAKKKLRSLEEQDKKRDKKQKKKEKGRKREEKKQKKKEKERKRKEKKERKLLRKLEKELENEKSAVKPVKISEKSSKSYAITGQPVLDTSTGDKDALQFLATFGSKTKKKEKEKKGDKKEERSDKEQKINPNKKPKLENVKKHISLMEFLKPVTVLDIKPAIDDLRPVSKDTVIPTPMATPIPLNKTKAVNTDNINNNDNYYLRKPVGIRTPGGNREINPIYTKPATAITGNSGNSDFIIPGVNDTEESKILTRTFGNKWYLPANLYKIEAVTGLKYKRGRFSDSEKLLAMKLTTKFCQEQNMTLERFKTIFFDDMGTENGHQNRLSNFFVDVSQHFGGRPVVAVYDFLKRLYHPGNHRGTWTAEDDQILLREYQKHGPKWTLIGKELNRLGINCRDRYNIKWKHEGKTVNGPWITEEDDKLSVAIKDSIEASGTISWLWISEECVKTRTPLQCVNRWKILKDKVGSNIKSVSNVKRTKENWGGWKEDEDYLLIHSILVSGATNDESIPWKNLSVPGVPVPRHNPELFFRRWTHLKRKAEIPTTANEYLKENIEKVKKYLIKLSKSPAYIFSEDEDIEM